MNPPHFEEIVSLLEGRERDIVERIAGRGRRGMRLAELAKRLQMGLRNLQQQVLRLREVHVLEKIGAG